MEHKFYLFLNIFNEQEQKADAKVQNSLSLLIQVILQKLFYKSNFNNSSHHQSQGKHIVK